MIMMGQIGSPNAVKKIVVKNRKQSGGYQTELAMSKP